MQKQASTILFINNSTENVKTIIKNLTCEDINFLNIKPAEISDTLFCPEIDAVLLDYTIQDKENIIKRIKKLNQDLSFVFAEKKDDVDSLRTKLSTALDIKKLRDEIKKEQEQIAYIFKYSGNELIFTDINFDIISQNNKILKKADSSINNFVELIKRNGEKEALEAIKTFLKDDKRQITFRLILNKKDNPQIIKTTICKINKKNIHSGYLIIMNNVSEKFKIAQQQDYFIEMLTHDLKTPILAEERALQILHSGILGELNNKQKEMIKDILNSSKYLLRMTDNILTALRYEAKNLKLNPKNNKIKKTIEHCVDNIKFLLEETNQKIKINIEQDCNEFCYDEESIYKTLTNILINAIEHSPQNSTIYITIKKSGEFVIMSIRDEGTGISKEKSKHIFDEHTCIKNKFKKVGSGLGMYTSKKIMELHNGSITFNTIIGKGTEFILSFPTNSNSQPKNIVYQTIFTGSS